MSAPNPGEQPTNSPSSPIQPLRLPYGPAPEQFGDFYLPGGHGPHPVVILIHGGYWRARYDLTLMNGLAEDLAARGIAAWNIEYRRVGNKGGGWPGTLLDVARAADYLRVLAPRYNLDLQRIVPIGHSAGGHLALWLAARPRLPASGPLAAANLPMREEDSRDAADARPIPLAGVISLAGVVDLEMAWRLKLSNGAVVELLGGGFDEMPERYAAASPAAMLPLGVPQVLIHGTADENVSIEVSRAYTAAAQAAHDEVTYIELEGVDHFAVIDPTSRAWAITMQALQKLLETRVGSS